MPRALLLTVRFHDGRYHGAGDWPPAPARLFQALVAGAGRGAELPPGADAALAWLETLPAPVIGAPVVRAGQGYRNFVPNNDLDAVGGDIARIGEIRAAKTIRPHLFDPATPFLYAWDAGDDGDEAAGVCRLADDLFQLGRGVDMAWAEAEMLDRAEAETRLVRYPGAVYRPAGAGDGRPLLCPAPGSLASLHVRFAAMGHRFRPHEAPAPTKREPDRTKVVGQTFMQPPKPRFRAVPYESRPTRLLYDLRVYRPDDAGFHPWRASDAVRLVETVRDKAAAALKGAVPDRVAVIDRVFVGRDATEADKAQRIRIVPLPSIGFTLTAPSIRRVLVEIPPDCPLAAGDIGWAFSGLVVREDTDPDTGEVGELRLVTADDNRMLRHYGIGPQVKPERLWRTVTPAALPGRAARRRIDPARQREEAKGAAERLAEEERAVAAVRAALRHAGIRGEAAGIRVQREPFAARGARAEAFAHRARFPKERLWHVEIAFAAPLAGPMVLGDGRWLGLGLMRPVSAPPAGVAIFALADPETAPRATTGPAVLHALRRALMSRDSDADGVVSTLFSGHAPDGAALRRGDHRHVFLAADARDGRLARLYVIRPDLADRRVRIGDGEAERFARVTGALSTVRAGRHGVLRLEPAGQTPPGDPVLGRSAVWASLTDYRPTRHPKGGEDGLKIFVERDCREECRRRGLPRPRTVDVISVEQGPGGGVRARLRLTFAAAVPGPLLLGRDSHKGGGLFGRV